MKLISQFHFGTLLAVLSCAVAHGASISKFSPQGEIAQVRQVRATFSEPVIKFGDPKAPSPFEIRCSEAGSGRWADDKNWIYDFVRDLPPGTRCGFSARTDLKSLSGTSMTGKTRFEFNTGGPAVLETFPSSGSQLDEEQIFILIQNGPATPASVLQHLSCEVEGVRERIPVKMISGSVRTDLLKQFARKIEPERVTTVQCQQRLSNDAAVKLTWGAGIATPSGVVTTADQQFKFKVREAFNATFSCERENANAACAPILPVQLVFTAPVSRKLAQEIVLRSSAGKMKPKLEKDDDEGTVRRITFAPPFAENSPFTIELPSGFKDDFERPLANAARFPLKSEMGDYPPLAKFATAPFGIIELNAEPMLPVTLRRVENKLIVRSADGKTTPGSVSDLKVDTDAGIIAWLQRINEYHESTRRIGKKDVGTRTIGLLAKEPGVKKIDLPVLPDAKGDSRPFEVIGIPLPTPGFYVVELESKMLGTALLGRVAPMFVRTSALVTNLSVHVKTGRENGAVWVTTLDTAKPVADADVRISDCTGKQLWLGRTDRTGVAITPAIVDPCSESDDRRQGLFVSARKTDEKGRADLSFALTSWNSGIESYRFNLPTDSARSATVRAHTVFDRTLFRAGETASMKHLIRAQTKDGFALLPKGQLPTRVRIIHQGSNQEFQFPLTWRGGKSAETVFVIPKEAKLGQYEVRLDAGAPKDVDASGGENAAVDGDGASDAAVTTGSFRVEEFRLPVMQGIVTPPKGALVAPKELPLNLQLNYLNGGGASGASVHVTSALRNRTAGFAGYDEFSFATARPERKNNNDSESDGESTGDSAGDSTSDSSAEDNLIVADKLPVTLDKNGGGKTVIKNLPVFKVPKELLTEMTYADPNGEIQTVSSISAIWPAAVSVGIKADHWVSVKKKVTLTAVALDADGKPQAGVKIELTGSAKKTNSHRKRMVGGFYAYENNRTQTDLGSLCSGKSDARGLLICEVSLNEAGNVEIKASVADRNGNLATATTSVWVTRQDEIWFDGENQDRIDILPEKKRYQAGETARFQVRMPFRYATALVAVEREGVIDTMVVQLDGKDPTISVPIKAGYGPNVYVSVLAVRGRMREVPWYSFFKWGWKEPLNWWSEFREYQAPSATVDLAKPAYKFGVAEVAVGTAGHQLAVKVSADKASYPIRTTARVSVQVLLPDGKPAAGAEFALAAVDEALLELQPNGSWNLLEAMMQRRGYGMETATAQMQVVGRRHYGRKAIAAGGGGGKFPTRELLDTLLLWKPSVLLDANGRATIDVPLNDALSSFKIVAVAESGLGLFGTGAVSVRTTQDLQLISGLPPLVREGDRFSALVTVRNTTTRAMQISAIAKVTGLAVELAPKAIALPAGESRELVWEIAVPDDVQKLTWEINAQENGGAAVKDSIKFSQKVVPAVPVTVQQATLFQLDKAFSMAVAPPADSVPGRGGVAVSLTPTLSGKSAGLRHFFETYPYVCLEQKTSRAIGLRDDAMWQRVAVDLPTYLDTDGLAYYYPPNNTDAHGSDTLTAYVLATTHEVGYSIPPQSLEKMLTGLSYFVQGKITRDFWSPKKDLDVRKLAALEALSRYHRVQPAMLDSIQMTPNLWPTSALLDWIAILKRVPAIPDNAKRLAEADQIIRSRLNYQGTRMGFSTESGDYWWWLMASGDTNATRLILTMLDDPAWRDDLPKVLTGALQRQSRGHWGTTTANVWGSLALEKFAGKFESEKVAGVTKAALQQGGNPGATQSYNWDGSGATGKMQLPWPVAGVTAVPGDGLKLAHEGSGKPWATVQSLAAVVLKAPFSSGYRMTKTIVPVEQKVAGIYSRGDIVRVNLDIDAQSDMTWVVVTDPVPAGATLLGSGLGRDSAIATSGERPKGDAWVAYQERSFEFFRSYYEFVPKGKFTLTYTMRLNNVGEFNLPQTRAEAMYAPEMFGEIPNQKVIVK